MLSLLLTVVLLFLLTCSEGVRVYLGKGRAARKLVAAQEDVMADYNRFLWEEYHILGVDESYGTKDTDALQKRLEEYLLDAFAGMPNTTENGFYHYSIENLNCTDRIYISESIEELQQQIREYMKYKVTMDALQTSLEELQKQLNQEEVKEARRKVEESDAKAKEAEEGETATKKQGEKSEKLENEQPGSQEMEEDPRKFLKDFLKLGLVEITTGREDISKEDYRMRDVVKSDSNEKEEEEKVKFEKSEEITSRLPEQVNTVSWGNQTVTKALGIEYALQHFPNILQQEEENMQCQCEYLIAGKNSDYANIKSVIKRILSLRFCANFVYVLQDTAKVAEAQSVATAIVGVTANPAIVELTTYLLLGCESYGESILDVRALIQGEKVPFWKTAVNWRMSLSHFSQVLNTSVQGEKTVVQETDDRALSYEDYLRLLLWMQMDDDVKYKRMLNVMEKRGKEKQEDFQIERMICGFKTEVTLQLSPLFVQGIWGDGEGQGYHMKFQRTVSY